MIVSTMESTSSRESVLAGGEGTIFRVRSTRRRRGCQVIAHYLFSHLLTVITALTSTLMVVRLLSTDRTPQSLLAWILALTFLPLAAIPLYFLIGTRKFPRRAKRGMFATPAPATPAVQGGPVARVLQ